MLRDTFKDQKCNVFATLIYTISLQITYVLEKITRRIGKLT